MSSPAITQPEITRSPNPKGWVLILPGIMNVEFHLAWLKRMIQRAYPFYEVEVRRWGTPFGSITNLRAYDRNCRTAEAIAREIEIFRGIHPQAMIHVVGYSGGGGLAVMILDALQEAVSINRLVLIAAAISPQFPLVERILPKVRDCAVNYASRRDLQIGQGTKVFGNMDGTKCAGAGAAGFATAHPKLVEVHWHRRMWRYLHSGYHTAYLSPFWQRRYLLPALDPTLTVESIKDRLA